MHYLVFDVEGSSFFGSIDGIDIHFNDFLQIRLLGWEVFISAVDGWGFYRLEVSDDCVKFGDLTIFEYSRLDVNGVIFEISKL
jgi:hypothetical protein